MAFQVPTDLADSDLSLKQVKAIIDIRKRRDVLVKRIQGLPDKKQAMVDEISTLNFQEVAIVTPIVNVVVEEVS